MLTRKSSKQIIKSRKKIIKPRYHIRNLQDIWNIIKPKLKTQILKKLKTQTFGFFVAYVWLDKTLKGERLILDKILIRIQFIFHTFFYIYVSISKKIEISSSISTKWCFILEDNIFNSFLFKKVELKLEDLYFLKNFIDSTFWCS